MSHQPDQNSDSHTQPGSAPIQNPNPHIQSDANPAQNPNPYMQPGSAPAHAFNPSMQPGSTPAQNPNPSMQPGSAPAHAFNPYMQPSPTPAPPPNPHMRPNANPAHTPNPYVRPGSTPAQNPHSVPYIQLDPNDPYLSPTSHPDPYVHFPAANPRGDHARHTLYFGLQVIGLIVGLGVLMLSLNAPNLLGLLYPAESYGVALSILYTYSLWYKVILGASAICILTVLSTNILVPIYLIRNSTGMVGVGSVMMSVLMILLGVGINLLMLFDEDVIGLMPQVQADIAQVESGQLSVIETRFSDRTYSMSMPGPYSSEVEPVIYRVAALDPERNVWIDMRMPLDLDFELNTNQRYRIYYTDHFRVIVAIELLRS